MHACAGYKLSVLLGGPILASICLPNLVPLGGLFLARWGPLLAAKIGPGDRFLTTNNGPGRPLLATFFVKIGPGYQFLGDRFWCDKATPNKFPVSCPPLTQVN